MRVCVCNDERVSTYMSTLGESNARTNARLDLTEMYNACHADYFQHAVVVSRLTESLLFLVAPQIGATGPAENVHDDDAFERGQLDTFAVDFENDVAREIFQAAFLHHLSDARFQIVAFGLNSARKNAVNLRESMALTDTYRLLNLFGFSSRAM